MRISLNSIAKNIIIVTIDTDSQQFSHTVLIPEGMTLRESADYASEKAQEAFAAYIAK